MVLATSSYVQPYEKDNQDNLNNQMIIRKVFQDIYISLIQSKGEQV